MEAAGLSAAGVTLPPTTTPTPAGNQAAADTPNKWLPSSDSVQSVAGLVSVVVGVFCITALALATMAFIGSDHDGNVIVPLATAAFGVISAVVGAYLGIKIGTDQTKTLAQSASQAHAALGAVQGYVPAENQQEAVAAGQRAAAAVVQKP